jgi:hypothetical protein
MAAPKDFPMKTNTAYRITTIFAFLAATALCVPAHAETALHAGGWSYHIVTGNKVDYTSSHDLVAVEHKRVFAARFRNSFGRESYALGRTWTWAKGNLEAKVVVGAVRGYRGWYGDYQDKTEILPIIVPMLSYTRHKVEPTVLLMGEAIAFSFRIEL